MGWLIVGLFFLVIVLITAFIYSRWKKNARGQTKDVSIYDRVERECLRSQENRGEFEITLDEVSDIEWLELETHPFAPDQFHVSVKWRNQGSQCIYKIVATAGIEENSVTKQSELHVIPLDS